MVLPLDVGNEYKVFTNAYEKGRYYLTMWIIDRGCNTAWIFFNCDVWVNKHYKLGKAMTEKYAELNITDGFRRLDHYGEVTIANLQYYTPKVDIDIAEWIYKRCNTNIWCLTDHHVLQRAWLKNDIAFMRWIYRKEIQWRDDHNQPYLNIIPCRRMFVEAAIDSSFKNVNVMMLTLEFQNYDEPINIEIIVKAIAACNDKHILQWIILVARALHNKKPPEYFVNFINDYTRPWVQRWQSSIQQRRATVIQMLTC